MVYNNDNMGSNKICIFSSYSRCQNPTRGSNPFAIICPYHINILFFMGMHEDLLSFPDGNKIFRKQVLSNIPNNKKLLPAPLKIDPPAENGKVCILDDIKMLAIVREYVHGLNLTESEARKQEVVYLICGLITNGTCMLGPTVGIQLGAYMSFLAGYNNGDTLKLMWRNTKIMCICQGQHFLYPMSELPSIYQILLAYVELSTIKMSQGGPQYAMMPNIILDLDKNAFVLVNIDDPVQPIALNKDNATYTSPLILAGERSTDTGNWPSLFNRGIFGSAMHFGHQRPMRMCYP